jgi:branched-chain amino acid transport system ATP-binding protein
VSHTFAASLAEEEATLDSSQPILVFDDVSLSFAGVQALDGVSFEVGQRDLFAIIGPNGAGKTSIFNVMSGIYRPKRGKVTFLGEPILGRKPHEIAAMGLSRTFQNIELFQNLSVIDNLMLGRHHHIRYGAPSAVLYVGRARREETRHRAVVEDIIDFLEIEAFRKSPVGLLPYGIQKRVELGRALALGPKLLLLDEPVAGMNVEETEDMARFILDIRDELDIPMILVEHDMGLVMDLADRVLVIDFGRPIACDVPEAVQANPDVIRAYLGQEGT